MSSGARFFPTVGANARVKDHFRSILAGKRCFTVRFDADEQETIDTIEAHLDKSGTQEPQVSALSVKREVLSLYRDVIRYSRLFVWKDERGREWGEVLRNSARGEFEAARYEKDPELVWTQFASDI
mmetsp:Transcript_31587/g.89699  ORF Transcript_31587/g.89699 Transcript_31587/m.89699 type:complete len:126 (+) Transcript_31587:130-507(+)